MFLERQKIFKKQLKMFFSILFIRQTKSEKKTKNKKKICSTKNITKNPKRKKIGENFLISIYKLFLGLMRSLRFYGHIWKYKVIITPYKVIYNIIRFLKILRGQ